MAHTSHRKPPARRYYVSPIDVGFRLVGLIRIHWRGLSGGADFWREIDGLFAGLDGATPALAEERHA